MRSSGTYLQMCHPLFLFIGQIFSGSSMLGVQRCYLIRLIVVIDRYQLELITRMNCWTKERNRSPVVAESPFQALACVSVRSPKRSPPTACAIIVSSICFYYPTHSKRQEMRMGWSLTACCCLLLNSFKRVLFSVLVPGKELSRNGNQ